LPRWKAASCVLCSPTRAPGKMLEGEKGVRRRNGL
jgi:hypothetical protein